MGKWGAGIGCTAIALLWTSAASADLVRPPPKACPPGSHGVSGHAGPACVVSDCSSDGDCKTGESCRDTALCTHDHEYRHRRRPGQTFHRTVVTGECASGPGACKTPASCSKATRCVKQAAGSPPTANAAPTSTAKPTSTPTKRPPPSTSGLAPKGASNCSLGEIANADPAPTGLAAAALLGLLLAVRRRRTTNERG